MRILLDQNLSPKLIRKLADIFPGLESVYHHNLIGTADPLIFRWTQQQGIHVIINSERDFVELAERLGSLPKVICIRKCDFPSSVIEQLIRREAIRLYDFLQSDRAVLILRLQDT